TESRFSVAGHEPCPDFFVQRDNPDLRFLSWDLEPGDVVCHHPLTVHGAEGNPRGARRVGVSVRYLGRDVVWDPRPGTVTPEGSPELVPGTYPAHERCFPVAYPPAPTPTPPGG